MKHIKVFEDFLNEETADGRDTLGELNDMTLGQLERIGDYAEMIKDRMVEGQQLESWMYSQLTVALENLNSVHDAMDGNDGTVESLNEEIDIHDRLTDLMNKLQVQIGNLQQEAKGDKDWSKALSGIKSSFDQLEDKISIAAKKLGVINEGVVSIKGGRILAHKVLNKLVDMEVIPVKKKTEDLVETIASLLATTSMNEAYDFIKKTPFSTLASLAELSKKFNLRKFWSKKDTFRGFDMKMLLPALNSSLMKNKIGLQFNPEHSIMLSADLNPYIGLHIVQKSVGVTLEIGKPTNPAYKKSDAIGGDTYEEIADIIAKILKDNSGVIADLQKIEKHPFQQNEAIDVKYWTDYNTDTSGQSDPEFAIKSKDFEATFKEAVKDWNDRGEDPITMGEAEKVKKIAKEFFNKAGWISVNVAHAMIAQES